jgi:hypothetical protein
MTTWWSAWPGPRTPPRRPSTRPQPWTTKTGTVTYIRTCRDESCPPCRRLSDTSRLCSLQLSGSRVCMSLWLSTCPLYFMPSLFCTSSGALTLSSYSLSSLFSGGLASLPFAILTDSAVNHSHCPIVPAILIIM